ncbi:MAG: phosphoenolpyruvate---glycerone phosphotransferase subunit DhaL [Chloroflexota bacterium]|nr:phosphoenolpyruvate---glycerone phosphotransferase subunit DhaL [Chloroflexota bacterium]
MTIDTLSVAQVKDAFHLISERMIASKDLLTQADQAIGDGDHGIGMARGFEAVEDMLQSKALNTVGEVFFNTGTSLMASIGGASGAIFGSFFMGAGKALPGADKLDTAGYCQALEAGLAMVKKRGSASVGDKTMVDALEPAVNAAKQYDGASLEEMVGLTAAAARAGMEETKTFTARIGKAKTLGERTLGHADPGAISITLILEALQAHIAAL